MAESIDAYLKRKKAKGTLGRPKAFRWRDREILTGYCPCPDCDHEVMLECDPDYDDCQCCHEVCS